MARKTHDLVVVTGEFKTNTGETKKRYLSVGAVIEYDDGGKSLLIERWFNPAGVPGDGAVRVSMFEPKPRDQAQGNAPSHARADYPAPPPNQRARADSQPVAGGGSFDDDIPF